MSGGVGVPPQGVLWLGWCVVVFTIGRVCLCVLFCVFVRVLSCMFCVRVLFVR